MKELPYKPLTIDGFAKYGQYVNLLEPSGPKLGQEPIEFYRDMVQAQLGSVPVGSFGVCRVLKRPLLIDVAEYHDSCCETLLPLDGDVLVPVAPAGPEKEYPFDQAEVFLVPRGTLAVLRPGVWHHAPYAFGCGCVNCLIMLPERTYVNDCKVHAFPEEKRIKIVSEAAR